MSTRCSWLNPKLKVGDSPIHGKGLFARENIPSGERLAIFGGEVMWINEIHKLPEQLQEYPMQIEERFVIGSRNGGEPEDTDFFNHSCKPNSGFKGQVFLVAMQDIRKGTEVTFDYAMVLSESVGSDIAFEMECNCGVEECRKTITENDWKIPELQRRYWGFFSQYLEDKMSMWDFMELREGDVERSLNKKIDTLIVATESYVVYLDEDLFVEWSENAHYGDFSDSFGAISNGVAHLETLSIALLSKAQLQPFRRLLGECMARSLEHDDEEAEKILKTARSYLDARSAERARMWYLTSAAIATAISMIAVLVIVLAQGAIPSAALPIAVCAPFGALGALISIIRRSAGIKIDAAAGPTIHYVEGAARVIVGIVGALLLSLAVKLNLVLGFLEAPSGDPYPLLIVACIIAGASERIVPTLIHQVEGSLRVKSDQEKTGK